MSILQEAKQIVEQAENSIIELVKRATDQRDYPVVARVIELAEDLRRLADDVVSSESDNDSPPPAESSVASGGTPARQATRKAKRKRTTRKAGKKGYPKFLREGKVLVKIAWSKSQKAPYEHKAPRKVLSALITKLLEVGRRGRRFVMDDILPLTDLDGIEIPNYQPYLCISWLRTTPLLEQHGRQGYSIPNVEKLKEGLEEHWQLIPKR